MMRLLLALRLRLSQLLQHVRTRATTATALLRLQQRTITTNGYTATAAGSASAPVRGGGTVTPQPDGRVVNGRGYTQIRDRGAEPAPRANSGNGNGTAAGWSGNSGGGVSSGGYSSGSSSSGLERRTRAAPAIRAPAWRCRRVAAASSRYGASLPRRSVGHWRSTRRRVIFHGLRASPPSGLSSFRQQEIPP